METSGMKVMAAEFSEMLNEMIDLHDFERFIRYLSVNGNKRILHIPDEEGAYLLHDVAAEFCGEHKGGFVKAALVLGAEVNVRDRQGKTPLMYASECGCAENVRVLLAREARVTDQDKQGWSALHYAVREEECQVIKLLLEKGADMFARNKEGRTPVHLAAACENPMILQLLIGCCPEADIEQNKIYFL